MPGNFLHPLTEHNWSTTALATTLKVKRIFTLHSALKDAMEGWHSQKTYPFYNIAQERSISQNN